MIVVRPLARRRNGSSTRSAVRVTICRIRAKIDSDDVIETVSGVGYRLKGSQE
ncbi:helix-turn-helix domain-containing protein [Kibdelosporangium philippinense]|uniref:helix-turn-helix domain-containing protein n=1 Tax=Kibdelosporangium philippinense TaxID=211113 RepID=UPI0035592A4D